MSGALELDSAFADVVAWRRDLHQHPELDYDVHRTAGVVAQKLAAFGCDEVVTGLGRTGVVGVIRGRVRGTRVIGLRADMDALPILEATGAPHQSLSPGKMHACGHDGHTAMLLGAAQRLCATRDFAGAAVVIFQPAEEGGGGGLAMVQDGLMDRFGIEEVYGMHIAPDLPVGAFATRPGPIMASADRFAIEIEGCGGHAAHPDKCVDPITAGAQIVAALQTIVSRNIDPLAACVVSVTQFNAGTSKNIIPQTAHLGGTVRALAAPVRDFAEARVRDIVEHVARALQCTARIAWERGYPVTANHARETERAIAAAASIAGRDHVIGDMNPVMGAEDFSYMLEARPGAFVFIGNGPSAGLHHPAFDFNDAAIPHGIAYWTALVGAAHG